MREGEGHVHNFNTFIHLDQLIKHLLPSAVNNRHTRDTHTAGGVYHLAVQSCYVQLRLCVSGGSSAAAAAGYDTSTRAILTSSWIWEKREGMSQMEESGLCVVEYVWAVRASAAVCDRARAAGVCTNLFACVVYRLVWYSSTNQKKTLTTHTRRICLSPVINALLRFLRLLHHEILWAPITSCSFTLHGRLIAPRAWPDIDKVPPLLQLLDGVD